MAFFHVSADVITKGKMEGGATGFATYLLRQEPLSAEQERRYLERDGHGAADLVASGSGHLPAWAESATHFWQSADRFEYDGWVVARTYQITLPHELSAQGRLDLAADIRATFFERYPHTWALHVPTTTRGDGERIDQPHLHLMFSTRREDEPSARTPKQWFKRVANHGRDPMSGGIKKDGGWDEKRTLQGVRAGSAMLINAALEREAIQVAVSQERLSVRNFQREPERVHSRGATVLWKKYGASIPADWSPERQHALAKVQEAWKATLAAREMHHEDRVNEAQWDRLAWHHQKQREGIRDMSRDAIVDHVRDRFWLHDRSPAREQERAESLLRAIGRECERTGRAQVPVRTLQREQGQTQIRTQQRTRLRHGHSHGRDDAMHGGVQIRLGQEREYAHERG